MGTTGSFEPFLIFNLQKVVPRVATVATHSCKAFSDAEEKNRKEKKEELEASKSTFYSSFADDSHSTHACLTLLREALHKTNI